MPTLGEFLWGYLQCLGGVVVFFLIVILCLSPLLFMALRQIDEDYYDEEER